MSDPIPLSSDALDLPQADFPSNPLVDKKPISQYKIFNVFFEDAYGFKVLTAPKVQNMAYLYEGDQQIGRVRLTKDNKTIQKFDLATDPSKAREILERNPEFPFRQQLEELVKESKTEQLVSEFDPTPETIQKAEAAFQKAFDPEHFAFVPASLIGSILREQPDAVGAGLHIREYIEGHRDPGADDKFNYAFGWFLGNGYEMNEGQRLAGQLVRGDMILITSDLNIPDADIEQKRLAFHEGVHRFFTGLEESKDPELHELSKQLKDAYSSIVSTDKLMVERMFDLKKYIPRQKPEEFWSYFLSSRLYPPPEGHPVQRILAVGNDEMIQKILERLPFIKDLSIQGQQLDVVMKGAKKIENKGKI